MSDYNGKHYKYNPEAAHYGEDLADIRMTARDGHHDDVEGGDIIELVNDESGEVMAFWKTDLFSQVHIYVEV